MTAALVKYLAKPKIQSTVNLSSKGQIVISARARKLYLSPDIKQFEQDIFSDGTIVLRPKSKISKREAFIKKAEDYYKKFGAFEFDKEERALLDTGNAGEEIFD